MSDPMNEPNSETAVQTANESAPATRAEAEDSVPAAALDWHTPQLEDVSEQVMAQPYIRFT